MSTVQQVLDKFAIKFPDVDAPTQLSLFNDAHKKLLSRIQLRNGVVYITLVAQQREYALDPSVTKIESAYFQQDANTQTPLTESSTDWLDVSQWGWRSPTYQGQPTDYYVSASDVLDSGSLTVGLVPIPSFSSVPTYPRIVLYCSKWVALDVGDNVPASLLSDNYYLYEMYAKWTAVDNPAQQPYWQMMSDSELQANHEHIVSMQTQGQSGFFPAAAYFPTRIR